MGIGIRARAAPVLCAPVFSSYRGAASQVDELGNALPGRPGYRAGEELPAG
jgi:hypothetical protein